MDDSHSLPSNATPGEAKAKSTAAFRFVYDKISAKIENLGGIPYTHATFARDLNRAGHARGAARLTEEDISKILAGEMLAALWMASAVTGVARTYGIPLNGHAGTLQTLESFSSDSGSQKPGGTIPQQPAPPPALRPAPRSKRAATRPPAPPKTAPAPKPVIAASSVTSAPVRAARRTLPATANETRKVRRIEIEDAQPVPELDTGDTPLMSNAWADAPDTAIRASRRGAVSRRALGAFVNQGAHVGDGIGDEDDHPLDDDETEIRRTLPSRLNGLPKRSKIPPEEERAAAQLLEKSGHDLNAIFRTRLQKAGLRNGFDIPTSSHLSMEPVRLQQIFHSNLLPDKLECEQLDLYFDKQIGEQKNHPSFLALRNVAERLNSYDKVIATQEPSGPLGDTFWADFLGDAKFGKGKKAATER